MAKSFEARDQPRLEKVLRPCAHAPPAQSRVIGDEEELDVHWMTIPRGRLPSGETRAAECPAAPAEPFVAPAEAFDSVAEPSGALAEPTGVAHKLENYL